MDTQPTVDLIVLNWNAKAYLDACLRSLAAQEYPHARIILVDNASSDDSVTYVRTQFPDVEVIASTVNRGFSGGNNLGLAHSQADIAVLVNPDVETPPGWLTALIAPMLTDARVGIAGSLLCDADGAIQHAGGLVKPPIGLTEHVGRGSREAHAYAAVADVDYVIGAAMAIRREVVERIGGLDETFFLYYEDADYCARARHAGFRVVYAPTPPVVHHESATTGKESQFYLEQLHTSRWRYLVKHTPADTLTSETVAAERAWTATRSLREQRAFVRAYRRVLQELPRLWAARVSGESSMDAQGQTDPAGREQIDRGQMDAVAAELAALVDAAAGAQTDSFRRATAELGQERQHAQAQSLEQLQRASYVVEQPLTSQAPVIGPLLAWFRNLWNNVATTWYVRPLLQQQNDYNALVYAKLEEMAAFQRETYAMIRETHALLAGMNERMIDDDRDVTELARQVGALEAVLVQWERRLDAAPSSDRPPGTDPAA